MFDSTKGTQDKNMVLSNAAAHTHKPLSPSTVTALGFTSMLITTSAGPADSGKGAEELTEQIRKREMRPGEMDGQVNSTCCCSRGPKNGSQRTCLVAHVPILFLFFLRQAS